MLELIKQFLMKFINSKALEGKKKKKPNQDKAQIRILKGFHC
jgi:hypothetical protein